MTLNICIMFLIMFPSWIVAENTVNKGSVLTQQIFVIFGLIFGSVSVTLGVIGFAYVIMTCIKRKMSEPQYFMDDTSSNKDSCEYHDEKNDTCSHIPNINRIQPVVNVSGIIPSIKQCLNDLYTSLIPYSWSNVKHMYNQQEPVNEKKDSPI